MYKSAFNFLYYWFNALAIRTLLLPEQKLDIPLTAFGDLGAAWKIPLHLLNKKSICYCGGVGEDITFELALSKVIQPHIFCFDPTPRAINYIKTLKLPTKLHFYPWGLWSQNSKQKFFAPPSDSFVSHSIVNLHQTTDYFLAECKRIDWILNKLNHTHIDLLKIDIEGAEYTVLNHLLTTELKPQILAIEFDQPTPVLRTYLMIKELIKHGYTLCDQTDWNFIFVYTKETEYAGSHSSKSSDRTISS